MENCLWVAGEEADAESDIAPQFVPVEECTSCKIISDILPFAGAFWLVYHAYKNRLRATGRQRIKLYIVNGLFAASKCFHTFMS